MGHPPKIDTSGFRTNKSVKELLLLRQEFWRHCTSLEDIGKFWFKAEEESAAARSGRRISSRAIRVKFVKLQEEKRDQEKENGKCNDIPKKRRGPLLPLPSMSPKEDIARYT